MYQQYILITINDEFPIVHKMETPSHYLFLKILAISIQSKSVLPLNSLYLLKCSADLKWMVMSSLSIADTVEIGGEKRRLLKVPCAMFLA